jgi:hypothetical protein
MIHVVVLAALAIMPERLETSLPFVSQFAASAKGRGIGNGVAISPTWVLSCGQGGGRKYWIQDGRHIKIKRRVDCYVDKSRVDLALFKLKTPVKEFVSPLFLPFEGKGGLKLRGVRLVGFGETGVAHDYGYDRGAGTAGKKRYATNIVDSRMFYTGFAPFRTQVLVYDIDKPKTKDRGSLGYWATKYEGGMGAGDSGAPWLIKIDGVWRVVGISVYTLGDPKHGPHPYAWGAQGTGVDLNSYSAWIKKTISAR